jgi:DNA-binding FadR family transcriptional regulator
MVAQALRREIIACADGAHLGSEAELLARLGVSSPTLRQAARLLEQQQLLRIGRGNRGGYFARRPDAGATAKASALYLEANETPLAQMRAAVLPLLVEVVRLAARAGAPDRREAFVKAFEDFRELTAGGDVELLLQRDRALTGAVLRLAGNPAIELFVLVSYRLGRIGEPRLRLFRARADYAEAWRRHTLRLGAAILEMDAELAELYVRSGSAMAERWASEFQGEGSPSGDAELWRSNRSQRSLAQMAADELRDLILGKPSGAFLGSEEELATRFKVSRHTLRQAAVLAQHDGLLDIRRGVNGGYLGRRPDIGRVVDAAALYLELNHGTLRDLMAASLALVAEACRLAARSTAPDYADRLRRDAWRMSMVGQSDDDQPTQTLWRAEWGMMETILELSANRPIQLFVRTLYRYGSTLYQPVEASPDRAVRWRHARLRMIEAMLERDGEAAAVICGRVSGLLNQWLE